MDLVRSEARTPENFAAVMGYVPPPEQEKDSSAGIRLLLAHVVPQDRERVAAAHEEVLAGSAAGKLELPGSRRRPGTRSVTHDLVNSSRSFHAD